MTWMATKATPPAQPSNTRSGNQPKSRELTQCTRGRSSWSKCVLSKTHQATALRTTENRTLSDGDARAACRRRERRRGSNCTSHNFNCLVNSTPSISSSCSSPPPPSPSSAPPPPSPRPRPDASPRASTRSPSTTCPVPSPPWDSSTRSTSLRRPTRTPSRGTGRPKSLTDVLVSTERSCNASEDRAYHLTCRHLEKSSYACRHRLSRRRGR